MSTDSAQDPLPSAAGAPQSSDAPPLYPPPPGVYPAYPYGEPGQASYPMYPVMVAMPLRTSGFAIASLICSLLTFVGLWFVAPILGVIFGHLAINEIKKSNGMVEGQGMAVAGLIVGYIGLGLSLLCIGFYVLVLTTSLLTSPNP
jgi:uncharacterized protein DUF4190